jgi:hypothetical protein
VEVVNFVGFGKVLRLLRKFVREIDTVRDNESMAEGN